MTFPTYEVRGVRQAMEQDSPIFLMEIQNGKERAIATIKLSVPHEGYIPDLAGKVEWDPSLDHEGQKLIFGFGESVYFTAAIAELYNYVIQEAWTIVQEEHKSSENPNIHDWIREKIWMKRQDVLHHQDF